MGASTEVVTGQNKSAALASITWRRRRLNAGAIGDQTVMFDPTMQGEVECGLAQIFTQVEIAIGHNQLIVFAYRARHNLYCRRHDARAADLVYPLFGAGFRGGHDP